MTKVKFILSSVSSGSLCWSVNNNSIYEKSKLNVFKNIKIAGEIFNNWPNDLFGTKLLKYFDIHF